MSTEIKGNYAPWYFILLAAMAGGIGWGIRGQYGHETGAAMAVLHVMLVIGMWFVGRVPPAILMKALALATLAGGFGGSMTYGQTLGLTQDAPLIGNWNAWWWGMLGIFLKGGIWIAFVGLFLGIGFSRNSLNSIPLVVHSVLSVFVLFLGVALFNEPFNPQERELPWIYFSDHWRWEPDAELKPRRERWGGLLCVLIYWIIISLIQNKDKLPAKLALAGFLSGGMGFALGQSFQSFQAWNPEFLNQFQAYINWWNFMETIFGFVWGGGLAFAIYLNRKAIFENTVQSSLELHQSKPLECISLIIVAVALLVWNLGSFTYFDYFADLSWTMMIVPLIMISFGRLWPTFYFNVIVALPIMGKTIREMSYKKSMFEPWVSFIIFGLIPLLVLIVASRRLNQKLGLNEKREIVRAWCVNSLITLWIYQFLNFAFFEFPWFWKSWTSRTPNAVVFILFAAFISVAAWNHYQSYQRKPNQTS